MTRRITILALLTGVLALAIPDVARAELKLAIIEVKGMVCSA